LILISWWLYSEERPKLLRQRGEIENKKERKITTPLSAFELFMGANLSTHRSESVKLVSDFLRTLEILSFDLAAAEKAGEIEAELRKSGKPIDIRDTMIAGRILRGSLRRQTVPMRRLHTCKLIRLCLVRHPRWGETTFGKPQTLMWIHRYTKN